MASVGRWVDRTRPLWRVGNRFEALQHRRFGRSLMSVLNPGRVLLLESVGRTTGRARFAPVGFLAGADGTYVIGGGAAGMTVDPDWVRNLRAEPVAAVWIDRRRVPVVAYELTGDDRDVAQREAAVIWPGVPKYERRSGRRIPYFRLVIAAEA